MTEEGEIIEIQAVTVPAVARLITKLITTGITLPMYFPTLLFSSAYLLLSLAHFFLFVDQAIPDFPNSITTTLSNIDCCNLFPSR